MSEPNNNQGSIRKGVWTALYFTSIAAALGLLGFIVPRIASIFIFPALLIGVVQLLWMVPVALHFHNAGQKETVKGIWIVAGIIFLLNASCWGLFMTRGWHP